MICNFFNVTISALSEMVALILIFFGEPLKEDNREKLNFLLCSAIGINFDQAVAESRRLVFYYYFATGLNLLKASVLSLE